MISVSSSIRFMKRGHCGMAEKGEQSANANDLTVQPNKRLERTRRERASLVSCVGEPLKRSVGLLQFRYPNKQQH
jgi:hypothetical protein